MSTLQLIGEQLDRGIYPTVYNGGIVQPCDVAVFTNQGADKRYERERSRRSTTGQRERSTGRQRPTNQTAPLFQPSLKTQYESELDAVQEAYPKTQAWPLQKGLLIATESKLLDGLDHNVVFLIAIPYFASMKAKGWGFWGISNIQLEWIGPRHTNFPDGSICAFEPKDGTWDIRNPIVDLIDLYSLWALRHCYLKTFHRWPGYQSVPEVYERILELNPEERCGCDNADALYRECCQPKDKEANQVIEALSFYKRHGWYRRSPPAEVADFLFTRREPSKIINLL